MPTAEGAASKKKSKKSRSVSDLSFKESEEVETLDKDATVETEHDVPAKGATGLKKLGKGDEVETLDKDATVEPEQDVPAKGAKGLKKLGKGLKNIFRRKSAKKKGKNEVEEITIVQDDDTDYEKQWSRKVNRAASFADNTLLSTGDDVEDISTSRTCSSAESASSSKPEGHDIPVILDAEEDDL